MADVSKFKNLKGRRAELGTPPTLADASVNLTAPEVAPVGLAPAPAVAGRVDGRRTRKTNRTVQFATRVTPDWDARIRAIAQAEGVMLVEILEKSLELYENKI